MGALALAVTGLLLAVLALWHVRDTLQAAHLLAAVGIALLAVGALRLAAVTGRAFTPADQPAAPSIGHGPAPVATAAAPAAGANVPDRAPQDVSAPRLARFDRHLRERIEALQDLKWEVVDGHERYRALLDSQADVIVRHRRDGTVTFANRAAKETFDLGEDVSGRCRFAPDVLAIELAPPAGVPGRPGIRRYRNEVATRAGPRWFDWEEQEVRGGSGDGVEIQRVGRDVTEDRRIEQSLEEARDLAQAANRAKSRFLAAMSHEIRTPMNGILGMTSLLADMEQTPEEMTYLNAIEQSAHTLLALIDEILDFSKIEAGKLALRDAPFDLEQCVESSVELLAPRAFEKGLEFAWTYDPQLPRHVRGDEARLRQILLNLVSNAIKFTDTGGVVVTVSRGGAGMDSGAVAGTDATPQVDLAGFPIEIAVRDSGIGLSASQCKALFHEFEQAEHTLGRQEGGTGLGLAISQRLARAMGGEICVESKPGQGSTFTARLRLHPAVGDAAGVARGDDRKKALGGSVLIVSDRAMERRSMAEVLERQGLATIEAEPDDALEALRRAQAGSDPRAVPVRRVVFDADPDPSRGVTALAYARELFGDSVRGLVVVEPGSRPWLPTSRACGAAAYLVRPVRPATLLQQILEPGSSKREPPARNGLPGAAAAPVPATCDADAGAAAQPGGSAHVLLAEDNEINALMARRMIEKAGFTVFRVTNGQEAVAHMTAIETGASGAARPDVILMDIFMPAMDGVEAAQRINALCKDPPPIVALTANAFEEDRQRYLASGMVDYLAKPFELRQLIALLDRWLPGRRLRAGSARAS